MRARERGVQAVVEQAAVWQPRQFIVHGHDGRQSHVDLTGGPLPIAPSVVSFETDVLTQDGWVPASPHRAIDIDEIQLVIAEAHGGRITLANRDGGGLAVTLFLPAS